MKLFIVRHGVTDYNDQNIMQGHVNSNLTKEGKIQAEKLAQRLSKEDIDVVYCSDLDRCRETVKPFLDKVDVPIVYTPELRERNYGVFDGKPVVEYLGWLNEKGLMEDYTRGPEGGESLQEVKKRMVKWVHKILKKEKGKNVLIVTHGASKIALMLELFEKETTRETYEKYRPSNTSISIIEFDEKETPNLTMLNSTSHLNG